MNAFDNQQIEEMENDGRSIEVEKIECDGGTIATLYGQDVDTGEFVVAYSEARYGWDIHQAIQRGEFPVAFVPDGMVAFAGNVNMARE